MIAQVAPLTVAGLLLLGSIDAWLLATLVENTVSDGQIVTASTRPATKVRDLPHEEPEAKPLDTYNRIVVQPLFFKTRTPYVAPPRPLPPAPDRSPRPFRPTPA